MTKFTEEINGEDFLKAARKKQKEKQQKEAEESEDTYEKTICWYCGRKYAYWNRNDDYCASCGKSKQFEGI